MAMLPEQLPITPVATEGAVVAPAITPGRPPHTHTESTLAPTSEFMRYVLAALPSRYVLRGLFGLGFNEKEKRVAGIGGTILNFFGKPGDWLSRNKGLERSHGEAAGYNATLGLGSLLLTLSYSRTVYKDMKNIFSEAVAEELGKPAGDIHFSDLRRSENRIVKKTLENFWQKLAGRLAVDALFVPAALLRHTAAGDFVLGLKGAQLFLDTWKRKTTMFEDMVTFVNNKINPRNGLGQPVVVGEVFDLYQHYADQFHPDKMFNNVLEQGGDEALRWAKVQPIFQRIAELMNTTYAYKHPTVIDPATGVAAKSANFALPKFIYLLGHDLIAPAQPERTLALIEIANTRGIPAMREAQALLTRGAPMEQVLGAYHVTLDALTKPATLPVEKPSGPNGVIPKGSTTQLSAAPLSRIDAQSIHGYATPAASAALGI